jgi:hypothetical protein
MERTKFDLLFGEVRALRQEMHAGFAAIRTEMAGFRAELAGFGSEMATMRADVIAFHRQTIYVVLTLWVGVLGLFATKL